MIDELDIAVQIARSDGNPQQVEFSFESRSGTIDFLANLSVVGHLLLFEDVCMFPRAEVAARSEQILQELLAHKRLLLQAAAAQGFHDVELRGMRVPNSSSANPGKSVRLARRARS